MTDYEKLLGKGKIPIGKGEKMEFYRGKTVLVTGGGGSVGGVLVRMLARRFAERIIIFDIYENNAFELYLELSEQYPETEFCVEIGSVRDERRVEALFEKYRPHIVFHAAAHKHVSLMEENCAEAIKNNVFGTVICAECAEKHGCERFVLVSTDKAVRPTGVMGASKRVCEMLVLGKEKRNTVFCAVRFGNVFGSAGSVVPIFERQIRNGGPVTVTDKRMTRYFISLSDAGHLLLCAGAMAKHGELFVLDMGEPYRIWDIAEAMIRSYGKVPGVDIEIIQTGLRPGEKIFEEYLLCDADKYERTENDLVFIEKAGAGAVLPLGEIQEKLKGALLDPLCETDGRRIKRVLSEIISDYMPNI